MSCEAIAAELTLYFYGELTQENEERLEQHLETCADCRIELDRLRSFGRVVSRAEAPVPAELLHACRVDLARALRSQPVIQRTSWFERIREFMNLHVGIRVPAGALALLAVGYLAGKLVPVSLPFGGGGGSAQQAGFVNIRSVEPDGSGKVRVAFDNIRRGQLSGSLDDPKVRELLLQSMRDESNPGLRVEAVGIIKDHAGDTDVRNVLLEAMKHDPNVGVRLAAIDGLRQYGADLEVRKALTETLLNDANAGVRVKAIDLLASHKDDSMVGALQNLMQKENNSYVRMRVTNTLRDLNASVGTF